MARLILTQCFPPQQGGIETLMFGLAAGNCGGKVRRSMLRFLENFGFFFGDALRACNFLGKAK